MDKIKEDAEKYSAYLRQQMGERLTSAVAEVIEKRPSDPIQYLSEYLYKSKNMKPPNQQMLRHRRHLIQQWTPEVQTQDRNERRNNDQGHNDSNDRVIGPRITGADEGLIDYGLGGDGTDEYYEFGSSVAVNKIDSNLHVHTFIKDMFLQIGDLFNDDDVS